MGARREAVGREIGLAAKLDDAVGDAVGMRGLLGRVLGELLRRDLGLRAVRHEVVPLVAQHANDFGRERLIEKPDDLLHVRAIARGDGAGVDVLARSLAQRLDVGQHACAIGAINGRHIVLLENSGEGP